MKFSPAGMSAIEIAEERVGSSTHCTLWGWMSHTTPQKSRVQYLYMTCQTRITSRTEVCLREVKTILTNHCTSWFYPLTVNHFTRVFHCPCLPPPPSLSPVMHTDTQTRGGESGGVATGNSCQRETTCMCKNSHVHAHLS